MNAHALKFMKTLVKEHIPYTYSYDMESGLTFIYLVKENEGIEVTGTILFRNDNNIVTLSSNLLKIDEDKLEKAVEICNEVNNESWLTRFFVTEDLYVSACYDAYLHKKGSGKTSLTTVQEFFEDLFEYIYNFSDVA